MFSPFGFMATKTGGGGGDADATAYINEVISAGGSLTAGEQTAIDDLYTGLKADGVYTKMLLMYPFMGGTAASHAVEGIDPTNVNTTLTWFGDISGSAYHTSAGVAITTGANGYGTPNIAPTAIHSSVNDISFGWYMSAAASTGGGFIIGNVLNSTLPLERYEAYIVTNAVSTGEFYINTGREDIWTNWNKFAPPTERYIWSRESNTSAKLYENNVLVQTQTGANTSGVLNAENISLFSADGFITGNNQARGTYGFLFIGDSLTPTQVGYVDGRMNTFLTAIGR